MNYPHDLEKEDLVNAVSETIPETVPEAPAPLAVSEAMLYVFFDKLNKTHFDGAIPDSRIKWSDRIGHGKNHRYADFTVFQDRQFIPVIRLSKNLLARESNKKICQILFYEMIHIWLWNTGKSWGHTPDFHEKAKTFNFSALEIQEVKL